MIMKDVDVSIIFINFKTADLVKEAIASIKEKTQGLSYEIIVVDNSEDKEEFKELSEIEETTIIDARKNLGFGKANNLGANVTKGKYLYFLNTDTLLINNAIYELKIFLDKNQSVGVVGSNLYTPELKPNHSFYPYEKNLKNERRFNSFWSLVRKYAFHRRIDFNYSEKPKKLNGYVCGASLMIRRELFNRLGGFDKDIFMYAEESLLCYRLIHELHKTIYNVPSSKIIHFEGGSQKVFSLRHFQMILDGNFVYYSKTFGKNNALKYLKNEYKSAKKKIFISKILRIKNKEKQFSLYAQACLDKIMEVKEL